MSAPLSVEWTAQFKRDYKLAMRRHKDIALLDNIIRKLAHGEALPEKNRDHELHNDWKGFRECHITPDWLLIYKVFANKVVLSLIRTGSHSDLFG